MLIGQHRDRLGQGFCVRRMQLAERVGVLRVERSDSGIVCARRIVGTLVASELTSSELVHRGFQTLHLQRVRAYGDLIRTLQLAQRVGVLRVERGNNDGVLCVVLARGAHERQLARIGEVRFQLVHRILKVFHLRLVLNAHLTLAHRKKSLHVRRVRFELIFETVVRALKRL